MRVVDEVFRLVPRVEGEDERLEVVPVEEGDVRDESAQRKVGRDQVERVRRREVGRAQFLVLGVIESAVREQCRLVVYRPVLREDVLAHEGEVLRLPDVAVVHRRHENVRQADTDVLVKLEPEGRPEARRPDEVPVEAERKETHALVVGGAAEHVPYDGRVVVRKTEDRDTGENGEDPCGRHDQSAEHRPHRSQRRTFRDNFPAEHDGKDDPEEAHTL